MPEMTIREIAAAVNGSIANASGNERFLHYHFDTRSVTEPRTLFFALKSGSRDGHEFLPQLAGREGVAAVVSREFDDPGVTFPFIRVVDPLKAAQDLASHVREKCSHVKFVGVTGSAGKTTTKEFCYQLLSHRYMAYRSFKNWNNWIGMPFSLLNMSGDTKVAVFELAMSYPGIGEIDLLSGILKPDVAVVLNAFPAHLEFLKDVETVARAKTEIFNHLGEGQIGLFNGDQEHLMQKTEGKPGARVSFGRETHNSLVLKNIVRNPNGATLEMDCGGVPYRFDTTFVNRLHVENLFVAILVAQLLHMTPEEIQAALDTIKPLAGRGEIRQQGDFTIIDETYNSNPEALKKTLEWIDLEYKAPKIAVVGDMLEMGEQEERFHKQVGHYFASLHYDRLITVGARARHIAAGARDAGFADGGIDSFDHADEAGQFLVTAARPGSVILFKASRGIQLEKAVEALKADG